MFDGVLNTPLTTFTLLKIVAGSMVTSEIMIKIKRFLRFQPFTFGLKHSRMDQVKWSAYHFKLFKGCLSQILLGPFLNTLTHLFVNIQGALCHVRNELKSVPFW